MSVQGSVDLLIALQRPSSQHALFEYVQNAFETGVVQNTSLPCPSGSVCCADAKGISTVRTLHRNATVYQVRNASDETLLTNLSVFVNGSSALSQMNLTRSLSASRINVESDPSSLVCATNGSCFFVPTRLFCSNRSCIGISDTSYAAIPDLCSAPVGAHVLVSNNISDHFASFRFANLPVGSPRSDCAPRSLNASMAIFSCTDVYTGFSGRLPAQFASLLRPRFGTASVRAASLTRRAGFRYGAAMMEVLLASSPGDWEQEFVVKIDQCWDLGSSVSVSNKQIVHLKAAEELWLTFLLYGATLTGGNSQGRCQVSLSSFGRVLQTHVARISAESSRRRDLARRCTQDQVPGSCAPVDCVAKYVGAKSFYNASTGLCDPTPRCESAYNPATNQCDDFSSTSTQLIPYSPDGFVTQVNTTVPFVCVHGTVNVSSTGVMICICDFGWGTDFWTQKYDQFVYCNVTASTIGAGTLGYTTGPQWIGGVMIAVFVLAGVALVLIVLCCVCKARKRQMMRRQQNMYFQHLSRELSSVADARLTNPPATTCAAFDSENEFNFRLPSSHNPSVVGAGSIGAGRRRVLDREEIKRLAKDETQVFFRVDETSFVPGKLAIQAPFVEFRVDPSHPFAVSFAETPLTLKQAKQYIFV